MNLKSRLFGFAAASVLALSMTTGVMAQESAGLSADGSVTLKEGTCTLTLEDSNFALGYWTYDGEQGKYINSQEGHNWQTVTGKLYTSKPDGTCGVSVRSDGLTGEETGGVIGPENLTFRFLAPNNVQFPLSSDWSGRDIKPAANGDFDSWVQITSVPEDIQPDTYKGTVDFQISNTL